MAVPQSLPVAEIRLKYDARSCASMGNENNGPQTYRRRINTPVGCGLLVPTACTGEGNSPPRRQNVPRSSTRSSGEVSPLQLRLAGFPRVAFALCRLTVLEHAPRCCSTLIAFPKKEPRNPRKSRFRKEACEPYGCSRDAIEGHHPHGLAFLLASRLSSVTHAGSKATSCATTRSKAVTLPERSPLGPVALPNRAGGGACRRTDELTARFVHHPALPQHPARTNSGGAFQGEKQTTVTFKRAFHRGCMQNLSLMGSNPSSSSSFTSRAVRATPTVPGL